MRVLSFVDRVRGSLGPRSELLLLIPLVLSGATFAYFAFQPGPPNPAVQAAKDAQFINAAEQRAIAAFQAILKESREGTLSDLDAAKRVETDVLPAWKSARARLAVVRAGPGAGFFPPEVDDFFRLRQEAWEALVMAVRNNDAAALETQRAKWQAADAIIRKLRSRPAQASQ